MKDSLREYVGTRARLRLQVLCCAALAVCLLCACAPAPPKEKEEPAQASSRLHLPAVIASYKTLSRTVTAPGIVNAEPDHLIKVTSAMSGKLVTVKVLVGQRVKKGEVIATLDDRHIEEQLAQATSSLKTAETNITQIEGNLKFARENLERQRKLYKAEVAPLKDVVAAENKLENLTAQLASAKSQAKTAAAARDQIETELSYTRVSTPIAGVVSDRYLNVGDSASPNTPVAQVVDLDRVVIDARVPADSQVEVKKGDHALVASRADPDITFDARVMEISPVVDPTSDTFKILLSCPNPHWRLKAGQSVAVTIVTEVDRKAILVPRSALVPDPDKPSGFMAYIVVDGRAKRVPVVRGVSQGDEVEVVKGLKVGEKVLTREVYGLPDGTPVEAELEKK